FSASGWAYGGASTTRTLSTPWILLACCAAAAHARPATSTCAGCPIFAAAPSVFIVLGLSAALSCSAITRVVMFSILLRIPSRDRHRLVPELRYQLVDALHQHAGFALRRLFDFQRLEARRQVHAQLLGLDHVQRLFFRLHDIGQRDIARLIQAQVGGDH